MMEEILELHDPEIQPSVERQLSSLHLLARDAFARNGGLQPINPRERVFSQAVGGATRDSLNRELPGIIRRWTAEVERQGRGGAAPSSGCRAMMYTPGFPAFRVAPKRSSTEL